jgi:DNA-binding ferritin-like protein (Dps family)
MARADFWDDLSHTKKQYLIQHLKRTHSKYEIRQVQVDHLIELSEELLDDNFIAYFDALPSNYKKAFKSAWRQKQHKAYSNKKTVELSGHAYHYLDKMIKVFMYKNPDCTKSKNEILEDVLSDAYFEMLEREGLRHNWETSQNADESVTK